jgi:hypothetical protein
VFAVRVSPGGLTVAPAAPPDSDNTPATPNTVTAFVRPFCFEFLRFMTFTKRQTHSRCRLFGPLLLHLRLGNTSGRQF